MEDNSELIIQLCTRIWVIMEDISPIALTLGGVSADEQALRLGLLGHATDQIGVLVKAAISLVD